MKIVFYKAAKRYDFLKWIMANISWNDSSLMWQ